MSSLTIVTTDGTELEIPLTVARKIPTIANTIEDVDNLDAPLDLGQGSTIEITEEIMNVVVEYVTKFSQRKATDKENETFLVEKYGPINDKNSDPIIFKTIMAVNFLGLEPLLDALCTRVANTLKNKSVEEIRQRYNILNDFQPGEEERIRQENALAAA